MPQKPPLPLITERLILRRFEEKDWHDYKAYHSLASTYRFLLADVPDEKAMRDKFNHACEDNFANDGDLFRLGVELRQEAVVIGQVSLTITNLAAMQAEIGYVFNQAYAGKGFAIEAVRALMAAGFDAFGFCRIFARLDAENTGSQRLCQQLGMRQEAHFHRNHFFNGRWSDELVYALLDDEWRARSA